MPFDPALPATNSALSSAVMRGQLTSLKALIDAILTITSAQVDATNTLPAGDPASVGVTVNGSTLHFTFDIPQGQSGPPGTNGSNGSDGAQGPQGNQGEQGPPGEVTLAALNAAISGTAMNPTSVGPMSIGFSDPPTQADLLQVQDKFNELRAALFRTP